MDTTKQSFFDIMEALNRRMDQFESELQKTPPVANTTNSLAADFAAFKTYTAEVLRALQQQLELLAHNVDGMEMHTRRKILLLHGVPEDKSEDAAAVVVQIVSDKLKLKDFNTSSINRCQRMGRTSSDKSRPILVKLKDFNVRNNIWHSKTLLKGTGLTMSEFLTRPRLLTFMEARKRVGITKCWTKDGWIHIIGSDGTRHRISSLSELNNISPAIVAETLGPVTATTAKEPTVTSKTRRAAASSRK